MVESDDFVVKDGEVGIVAPNKVGAWPRDDCLEGGGFDYAELSTVAESEVMTVGAVPKVGGIDLSRPYLLGREGDFVSIAESLVIHGLEVSRVDFHRLSINQFAVANADNWVI